jgi:murein L,D-transpeptidase YcbB/YkuD
VALGLASAFAAGAAGEDLDAALCSRIVAGLASPDRPVLGERLSEPEALVRFYAGRAYAPAWVAPDGSLGEAVRGLRIAVEGAVRHGLHPAHYRADLLRGLRGDPPRGPESLAGLDLLLSDAFLRLARHLARGAVDPRALHPGYERAGTSADPAVALAAALRTGRIAEALAAAAPPHPEYAALLRALERLRAEAVGDAPASAAGIDRIRVNLERWRWLPRELGRRHLRVDIPRFELDAFRAGEPALSMRVVVGGVGWKTPHAHGVISHLVLNPAWQVPRSIATREMLPAARRDPGYFEEEGIQVLVDEGASTRELDSRSIDWAAIRADSFPFRLRQPPGPRNPLGPIKFVFPNRYSVYLHGTPADAAFERPLRALSHGCVRVEDEVALAAFALAPDPAWTRERLITDLRDAAERVVSLPAPLPVYLLYFTASADPEGEVSFVDDLYEWDRPLLAALDAFLRPVVDSVPRPAHADQVLRLGGGGRDLEPAGVGLLQGSPEASGEPGIGHGGLEAGVRVGDLHDPLQGVLGALALLDLAQERDDLVVVLRSEAPFHQHPPGRIRAGDPFAGGAPVPRGAFLRPLPRPAPLAVAGAAIRAQGALGMLSRLRLMDAACGSRLVCGRVCLLGMSARHWLPSVAASRVLCGYTTHRAIRARRMQATCRVQRDALRTFGLGRARYSLSGTGFAHS